MLNTIETAMWLGLMKAKAKMTEVFTNEDGAVDIIAVVVLIAIAIVIALVFKEEIAALVRRLFGEMSQSTDLLHDPA